MIYDLIIIGSGPSGFTAAIYGTRMGQKVLIIEKGPPGGRLLNTHSIENYPGFESISGAGLAINFYNHSLKFGTEFEFENVIEISNDNKIKIIKTESGKEFQTKTILIATGTTPKMLDLPNSDYWFGKGLSTCVICDGAFHRNQPIALIGGGNSATEESLFAETIASKVYIINKFSELNAEKITLDKVKKSSIIEILNNSEISEILSENNKISGINIFNNQSKETKNIQISGIFIYIGNMPNTDFLKALKITDKDGYVLVNKDTMETTIPGIYASGDVINKQFRQISTAVSDGTIASLSISKYLKQTF